FGIPTQNPIEHEGTYPLPEAQVDRFLLRIDVGYPTREQEIEVLERRRRRRSDDAPIEAVTTPDEVRGLQAVIEDVHVDPAVEGYMVDIVLGTRAHSQVEVGASPRGSLALLKVARARAAIAGRDFVTPDDVKTVAGPALGPSRPVARPLADASRLAGGAPPHTRAPRTLPPRRRAAPAASGEPWTTARGPRPPPPRPRDSAAPPPHLSLSASLRMRRQY